MTSTIASTSQAVTEWVKIFPKHATENYTSSVTFMKQLTVVAISTITYLKNAFPEDSYMVESFGGIRLRIIKKICRDECAQFLSTSLSQAFEAFDKRYLHQLALCFYEEECKAENLIEYHIFDYTYHGDGVTMNVHSKNRDNVNRTAKFTFDNVRERTIHMIRSCVVLMQSCQNQLPTTYNVSLRLYYNEDAPWDYQAPGFLSSDEDHLGDSLAGAVRLGWVETAFHKLLARSYFRDPAEDAAEASHEAIASQNPPTFTLEDVRPTDSSPGAESPVRLRCPCNVQGAEPGAPPALLTCHYCGWQQHAACFGVRRAQAALVSRHCCAACHDADRSRPPTDARLAPLSPRKRESLCIFRRTLEWCAERAGAAGAAGAVEGAALAGASRVSAAAGRKLLRLLRSHRVLLPPPHHTPQHDDDDLNATYEIDEQQLRVVTDRFFQCDGAPQADETDDLADRLLAETLGSQQSSDPLSEALSPLDQVSLHNTSIVGRLVPPPAVATVAAGDDPTIQQYRQAMLATAPEELASVMESGVVQGARSGSQRRTVKRKTDAGPKTGLRSGVKSKRGKTDHK